MVSNCQEVRREVRLEVVLIYLRERRTRLILIAPGPGLTGVDLGLDVILSSRLRLVGRMQGSVSIAILRGCPSMYSTSPKPDYRTLIALV